MLTFLSCLGVILGFYGGLYRVYIRVILGSYRGYIRVMKGLYQGYIGVMSCYLQSIHNIVKLNFQ